MNRLKIEIDENIDFSNPETITREAIADYYEKIHDKYGNFCGDCKSLIAEEKCDKKNRPRKYDLRIGPYDHVVLKMQCKDFELFESEIDKEATRTAVSAGLDCFIQQYC